MKKIILITVGIFLIQYANAQTYYLFPTDTATWNSLTWAQWSPSDIFLINSQYRIQGDTLLNEIAYNKVYYSEADFMQPYIEYIGGIREDSLKNIYFFPSSLHLPNYAGTEFPNDTSECLLYTFNNLEQGMILPINTDVTEIEVVGLDSILLGNIYRKRYEIQQGNLGDPQYWIEGIGSDKDLFAPYSYEFEWKLYTLCYTDTITYFINSPNGEDSCHYWIPLGVKEIANKGLIVYPNPTSQTINIESDHDFEGGVINIYNTQGQKIIRSELTQPKTAIDIGQIESGIYIVELINESKKTITKFVKE